MIRKRDFLPLTGHLKHMQGIAAAALEVAAAAAAKAVAANSTKQSNAALFGEIKHRGEGYGYGGPDLPPRGGRN